MKNLLFLTLTGLSILASCEKSNEQFYNKEVDQEMRSNDTIFEHYIYEGEAYTLLFDSEDTTGTPLNSDVDDELISEIGENDFILIYNDLHPDTTIIGNLDDANYLTEPDSSSTASFPGAPVFATFYEHANYQGESFTLSNVTPALRRYESSRTCQDEYNISNLAYVLMQNGTSNFNDRLSSMKLHQSGSAKTWYDNNGYSGNGTVIQFVMFRNAGYPQFPSGCYMQIWNMHAKYGTQDPDWSVPNFKKENWGFIWPFCSNMNDCISAISVRFCKSSNCSGGCTLYHDLID